MMYGLKFANRAMKVSEIQSSFYENAGKVKSLAGPEDVIVTDPDMVSSALSELEIEQFPQEIVSIIPPVLLQSRSPYDIWPRSGCYVKGISLE
jgi:hypothetical protein